MTTNLSNVERVINAVQDLFLGRKVSVHENSWSIHTRENSVEFWYGNTVYEFGIRRGSKMTLACIEGTPVSPEGDNAILAIDDLLRKASERFHLPITVKYTEYDVYSYAVLQEHGYLKGSTLKVPVILKNILPG